MQNLLVVCADKDLRKDLSRVLGAELNFLYVDVDDVLDFFHWNLPHFRDIVKHRTRRPASWIPGCGRQPCSAQNSPSR